VTATNHRRGFSATSNRAGKARKIIKILQDFTTAPSPMILDIGTGSGEIAQLLSQIGQVISVDIVDKRSIKDNYQFLLANESLPFQNQTFDIIISNHVIEHVDNQLLHLTEIKRVLKSSGVVYLATPNRLWFWEVHYRLAFLHYLPQKIFMFLLKRMNKYREDLKLISWYGLKKLANPHFKIHLYSDKICQFPQDYYLNAPQFYTRLSKLLPLKLYTLLAFIHPTIVAVLEKRC